ncbi:MAG: alanine--tRNA ligase [Bacteroidota bacterium]
MLTSQEIRQSFLNFFADRAHKIVPSAPMVIKNDPTLMFTNAGMNQFKDIFLGNRKAEALRVADSQKCLRVTGKHNDLEEVGHDTYHHTMFEMLGNWSFGDYFKNEAIDWAWEYLTGVLKLEKDRLYVTIFEGSPDDGVERDNEAFEAWKKHVSSEKILNGSKKDNFWEMGDTGPCGPCSEIHIDLRDQAERNQLDGAALVNKGNPLVIEIWNLVFIQYNRKADSQLELLPEKHVDTGMGFERLCMAVQGKKSNYDTDIFTPLISEISRLSSVAYGSSPASDIAMRVIADHLRAIAFSIADGQIPSNNKAGYVIRRILRRAVRYSYTYLKQQDPFIHRIVPALVTVMGDYYNELKVQQELIARVIMEEEQTFLRTLENGIRLLEQTTEKCRKAGSTVADGKDVFQLYDTYGFPLDLTELILREQNMTVDRVVFEKEMAAQKARSRQDAATEKEDWEVLLPGEGSEFTGYDHTGGTVRITRYRKVETKGKTLYHIVLDRTPFYAESGGQVGDRGTLVSGGRSIAVVDTVKENDLSIHITTQLPEDLNAPLEAIVNSELRAQTEANHSATHLLHKALRDLLGTHVEQKGSLVHPEYLRFDFSHFQKVSDEELRKIEHHVQQAIRNNTPLDEHRSMPVDSAREMGAMALFGEKYGDRVRVIRFGDSVELCGGTHVSATGSIGSFRIIKEGAVAAGIRRIEAVSGVKAEEYIDGQLDALTEISGIVEKNLAPAEAVRKLAEMNQTLLKKVEAFESAQVRETSKMLAGSAEQVNGISFIAAKIEVPNAAALRNIAFQLREEFDRLFLVLAAETEGKVNLALMISDELVSEKGYNAVELIRDLAKEINGGGGGQPFFATAGGKKPEGIQQALQKARTLIS